MFIGHLPAGYLATRSLLKTTQLGQTTQHGRLLLIGVAGSIFPDLDLFYFYLFDGRMHHHHSYWSHLPVFWFLLLSTAWLLYRARAGREIIIVFGVGVFLHLLLDTIVGRIAWLCPVDCNGFGLIEVPALYQPWWLNFLLHWTFGIEIIVTALALLAFWHDRLRRTPAQRVAQQSRRKQLTPEPPSRITVVNVSEGQE